LVKNAIAHRRSSRSNGAGRPPTRCASRRERGRCLMYRSEYRAGSRMDLALCSTKPCGIVWVGRVGDGDGKRWTEAVPLAVTNMLHFPSRVVLVDISGPSGVSYTIIAMPFTLVGQQPRISAAPGAGASFSAPSPPSSARQAAYAQPDAAGTRYAPDPSGCRGFARRLSSPPRKTPFSSPSRARAPAAPARDQSP